MSVNPTVVIKDADGIPIITENYQPKVTTITPDFQTGVLDDGMKCGSKHCYGTKDTRSCSAPLSGIPRDADIVIELSRDGETKSYEIHTPKTQFNYYLDQQTNYLLSHDCTSFPYGKCQGLYSYERPIFEIFTSNFGYNSDDTIWDSAVVRTP